MGPWTRVTACATSLTRTAKSVDRHNQDAAAAVDRSIHIDRGCQSRMPLPFGPDVLRWKYAVTIACATGAAFTAPNPPL